MKGAQELNKNLKQNLKQNLSLESWVSFLVVVFVPCLARHLAAVSSAAMADLFLLFWFTEQLNKEAGLWPPSKRSHPSLCASLSSCIERKPQKTYVGPLTHGTVRRQTCYVYCVCCVLLCACGGRACVCNTRGWNQTHGLFLVLVWPWRGAAHGPTQPRGC